VWVSAWHAVAVKFCVEVGVFAVVLAVVLLIVYGNFSSFLYIIVTMCEL